MPCTRPRSKTIPWLVLLTSICGLLVLPLDAADKRVSDIRSTKHNLSNSGASAPSRNVKARDDANGGTDEVCVFCHTPHGASTNPGQPLWNRADSAASYTLYGSSSLNASASMGQPSEQSKLCLSCHDGTLAIGAVGNAPGSGVGSTTTEGGFDNVRIRMQTNSGTIVGDMGDVPNLSNGGIDSASGFTRNLGVSLSNDHPISFPYTTELADADGELRDPASETHIAARAPGERPLYPLTGDNMQCTTCHDPHVKGQDIPSGTTVSENNSKFLRGPRFQISVPSGINFQEGVFNDSTGNAESGDIVCLACHNRELDNQVWSTSVHANPNVADEEYLASASSLRQFPSGIKVWQASCLNCHDTHSVAGSRRLLREGIDGSTNSDGAKSGGSAALEETCYQCHTGGTAGTSILDVNFGGTGGSGIGTQTGIEGGIPNIQYEFEQRTYHMPLTTADQRTSTDELHDITNADFSETGANLGKGNSQFRHAECTDCHNPHRMQRNNRFNSDGTSNVVVDNSEDSTTKRTHVAGLNSTTGGFNDGREGNAASGVLRGTWGVDIDYPTTGGDPFQSSLTSFPTSVDIANNNLFPERMAAGDFIIRSGDPGSKTLAQADQDEHLTREYQLCFKCHSSYSQDDRTTGVGPSRADTDLALGVNGGSTPSVTTPSSSNTPMTHYTNVAAEFLSVKATNPPTSGTDQGEFGNNGSACANGTDGITNDPCATAGTGADRDPSNGPGNNHRSWHPVVYPTGRDAGERGVSTFTNIRAPFADNLGTQTMYCSDCHGADGSWSEGSGPNLNQVQGPHGSSQRFVLKGKWDGTVEPGSLSGSLCGRCHAPATTNSGFSGNDSGNHGFSSKQNTYCMACHVAVPHGWKNKAFLVNLYCVGPEVAGHTAECTSYARSGSNTRTFAPYYNKALLRINSWAQSGSWQDTNCGGKDWMSDACENGLNY